MNTSRWSLVLLALVSLACGQAVGAPTFFPIKHGTALNRDDFVVGQLALSHPIHVVIALRLRNEADLDRILANAAKASDRNSGPLLSDDELKSRFLPTDADARAVAKSLREKGFTNVTIAANNLLVSADSNVSAIQTAFRTSLKRIQTSDGRDAFAAGADVNLDTKFQQAVLTVLGLQTVHVPHTMLHYATPQVSSSYGLAHDPTDFPQIYGASTMPAASDVTVGIVAEGSMTNVVADLQLFTKNSGMPDVPVVIKNVGGTGSDADNDGEWDLDSQDIVAMSGGVKQLVFYVAPTMTNADLTEVYNQIVTDNTVKIINVSLGECELWQEEDGSAAADDAIFKLAAVQGQTFSVSAGDGGADECEMGSPSAAWPASSRYVVAVGGTLLTAQSGAWGSEVVYNDIAQNLGATGGSPSKFEPMPSWQTGVGQNYGNNTRGVPDLAFDGDPRSGAWVILHGQRYQQPIGGTSLASPLFVGAWARIMEVHGSNLGFAAPLLYQLPSSDFHDVVQGGNKGENAGPGWDYTTGFGTLIVSQAAQHLTGPTP